MSKRERESVKPYPKEFHAQVVKLARTGGRQTQTTAARFGISTDSVRR